MYKSKPGTADRLKEMVDLGILVEGELPKETIDNIAKQIADEVDEDIIRRCTEKIMGS